MTLSMIQVLITLLKCKNKKMILNATSTVMICLILYLLKMSDNHANKSLESIFIMIIKVSVNT